MFRKIAAVVALVIAGSLAGVGVASVASAAPAVEAPPTINCLNPGTTPPTYPSQAAATYTAIFVCGDSSTEVTWHSSPPPVIPGPGNNAIPGVPGVQVLGTSTAITTAKAVPTKKPHQTKSSAIEVLPTSRSIETTAAGGSLSYTGVGFNVPLAITVGGLVVLAGFALMYFGGRNLRRGHRAH